MVNEPEKMYFLHKKIRPTGREWGLVITYSTNSHFLSTELYNFVDKFSVFHPPTTTVILSEA